jgi:hypothetical protein
MNRKPTQHESDRQDLNQHNFNQYEDEFDERELMLLRELGQDLDLASTIPPARMRARALGLPPQGSARRWSPRAIRVIASTAVRPARGRLGGRIVLAGGAVALAAGFVVAPTLSFGGGSVPATASAAEILGRAAKTAGSPPAVTVPAKSFVFVHTVTAFPADLTSPTDFHGDRPLPPSGTPPTLPPDAAGRTPRTLSSTPPPLPSGAPPAVPYTGMRPMEEESWRSVDASAPGLVRDRAQGPDGAWTSRTERSCPGGPPAGTSLDATACWPGRSYQPDLPATREAMRTYLYSQQGTSKLRSSDQRAFDLVGALLTDTYIPPQSRAALFEAAASIPGISVIQDDVDQAGRHGIAVTLTQNGLRQELIFDSKTYTFLGEKAITTTDAVMGSKQGTVVLSKAVLEVAIVPSPGARP